MRVLFPALALVLATAGPVPTASAAARVAPRIDAVRAQPPLDRKSVV
jgi:hypothetical protein